MGWQIKEVKNTVKINKKIACELYECGASVCYAWDENGMSVDDIVHSDGHLVFNPDHMEHMDYVHEDQIMKVLKKNKVKGDICFSSDDGDNAGKSLGYRFDGKGGMKKLAGKQTFSVPKKSKKKSVSRK